MTHATKWSNVRIRFYCLHYSCMRPFEHNRRFRHFVTKHNSITFELNILENLFKYHPNKKAGKYVIHSVDQLRQLADPQ